MNRWMLFMVIAVFLTACTNDKAEDSAEKCNDKCPVYCSDKDEEKEDYFLLDWECQEEEDTFTCVCIIEKEDEEEDEEDAGGSSCPNCWAYCTERYPNADNLIATCDEESGNCKCDFYYVPGDPSDWPF